MSGAPKSAADTLARLGKAVSYIRVASPDAESGLDEWVPGNRLVHDSAFLYETMRSTMGGRGVDRDDIGISLIVQGYAFRIASVAIGGWMLSGGVADVSPANVSIQFRHDRSNAVLLDRIGWAIAPKADRPADTLPDLHEHLVEQHMRPLVETARRAVRVGGRTLWSNVATSCASSFGALMAPMPDEWATIRAAADRFYATATEPLRAGGAVVPVGPTWIWQRNACCLWYQHADNNTCGDCSLHTPEERAARQARILAETVR